MTTTRLAGLLTVLLFACAAHADDGEDSRALLLAAGGGKVEEVNALLAKGVPVNTAKDGFLPLEMAVGRSQVAVAEALLAKGADPNVKLEQGSTVLHLAAQKGPASMVELLLAKGMSVDMRDDSGSTPLYYAAHAGQLDVVKLLVARKASLKGDEKHGTALHQAAMGGDVPTIEYLLSVGLKVNAGNAFGYTPLASAAGQGHLEAMKLLMSKGALTDGRVASLASRDETPLFRATAEAKIEAMKLLIERGANVDAKNHAGETPIFKLAIGSTLGAKEKEALQLLIANKADVNAKAVGSGRTVLATAVHHGNADAIEILKAAGAR